MSTNKIDSQNQHAALFDCRCHNFIWPKENFEEIDEIENLKILHVVILRQFAASINLTVAFKITQNNFVPIRVLVRSTYFLHNQIISSKKYIFHE